MELKLLTSDAIAQLKKDFPDWSPDWQPTPDGGLESQRGFGACNHVLLIIDGEHHYDRTLCRDPNGAVIVAYKKLLWMKKILLIRQKLSSI